MVCKTDVVGTAEYTGKNNNIRLVILQTQRAGQPLSAQMKNPFHTQARTITLHHAPRVGDVQLSIPEEIGTGNAEDTLLLAEQAVADWTILIAQSVQRELYKSPVRRGAVHGYLHLIVLEITVTNFCMEECLDFMHCMADNILYLCRRKSHTTRLPKLCSCKPCLHPHLQVLRQTCR